ncbi:unnamed protein product [Musa banksii]
MPANSSSPSSAAAPHRTITVFPCSPSGVNLCTSGSMNLAAGRAQDDRGPRGPRWGFLLRSTWFTPCLGWTLWLSVKLSVMSCKSTKWMGRDQLLPTLKESYLR